jgi:hypothetical protein
MSKDSRTERGSITRSIRRHPSMAVAVGALVFAMVGTATATQVVNKDGASSAKAKKGPRGPAGPAGAAGAAGANGFTGRVEVNTSAPYDSTAQKTTPLATCPAGKVVIGGGAIVTRDSATTPVALNENGPTSAGAANWRAAAYETTATAESWNIQVSLYCATP